MIILCRVHSPPRIGHESNIFSYTRYAQSKTLSSPLVLCVMAVGNPIQWRIDCRTTIATRVVAKRNISPIRYAKMNHPK